MPELPEAEFGRKLAERTLGGRSIVRVRCARDTIVFDGVSPTRVQRALQGRVVLAVHRWGKYLWFQLDQRPWPLFHFGMTGSFRVPHQAVLELASSPRRPSGEWPPRFTKIHLVVDGGGELVMTNARRLGRIRLRDDPRNDPPVGRLGFDPLLAMPKSREFAELFGKRRGNVKAVLLDQRFAAGVGNWIADEVLFQAGIDPRRTAESLGENEVRRLRAKLGHVIRAAVRVDANKARFPASWLFHHRWGKQSTARTSNGERIEHITVAGRTTAWVPTRQL